MKLSRLKILWEKYSKLKVFSSVFGVSFALLFVVVLFGVPHAAHAGIVSWFTDLVGSAADATFGAVFKGVGYVILMLANFILWIVGMLFNYVVVNTVFNFGSYFGNSAGLIAGWGVLRDIANILLIFGFVMLGLAVILDIHGYEVKKTLPRLIIFAILLNFSLLATEAVIDTANAFASIFYSQASTLCSGTAQDCASKGTDSGGISGIVTQMSGIATVFSPDTSGGSADSNKDGGGDEASNTTKGIAYIGMAVFVTILAVVLLAGTIMLVVRALTLAVLMILSPLGFAGLAIPPLEKYAMDWWHRLISQAFFAPVYLLFIFVGLKIAQGMSGGSLNLMQALTNPTSTTTGSIFIFTILSGFMIMALVVAKQMGAMGASFATNVAGKTVGRTFGGALGATGFVGRRTVGRFAAVTAQKIRGSEWAERRPAMARFLANVADKPGKSSFDARQLKVVKTASTGVGLDLGKPGETAAHGYHGIEEKATKERLEFAKSLKDRAMTKEERAAAQGARENAETVVRNRQMDVANLKHELEQDPQNQSIAAELAGAQKKLVDADEKLAQATKTLTEGTVKAGDRQTRYADNIEHSWTVPFAPRFIAPNIIGGATAAEHANHVAAGQIRSFAKLSPDQRMLQGLIEGVEKATKKSGGDGHRTVAPAKPQGNGAGDHGDTHAH